MGGFLHCKFEKNVTMEGLTEKVTLEQRLQCSEGALSGGRVFQAVGTAR